MVVVMVVTTAMRIITLVIVVMMMLVAMTMWVMAFTMFVMMIVVVMLFLYIAFYFLNPCSRGSHLIKVEEFGIKNFGERHIAIIAVYDFSFRLDSTKDSANMLAFFS